MIYVSFYLEDKKRKLGIIRNNKYVDVINEFTNKEPKGETYSIDEINFDLPINPSAIFCTLVNTPGMLGTKDKSEAKEMIKSPKFFLKPPSIAIPHNHPIISPKDAIRPEVEIAIITNENKIKNANKIDVQKSILGYSVFNDITYPPGLKEDGYYAYRRDPIDGKVKKIFVRGSHFRNKVRDTFAPFGPWIVTPEEISDVLSLSMKSYYNNQLIQEGSSQDFIFDIEEIIIELSKIVTIPPYSVITTGSIGYKNAEEISEYYLKPINNALMIAEIEKIGKLINKTIIEE
ncbi:2-hydroxyhepta-2,4-diene-1,7-dioate isomerase [Acidianus sulfidivorans JP7]|uniref:2-hydroxyhepta-2,4-diene-1,7-dioate isomerase n=1 Tax=Acidianus sulfidivorans JP7 TaxID=619593 RepID=A0A2U9ILJ1_9CREN|nr:fumarylacetoacetate hydrolase family protein [Acidianus sulfidivorans]AWR96918.1 2-hydroxyhepta-2,4-diene-1,7-dioate isomerase [Acidianus sulfidivorans JP7]